MYGVASMCKPSVIRNICLPRTLVVSVIALSATSKHFPAGNQTKGTSNSPREPTKIHLRSDRYIVTFNEWPHDDNSRHLLIWRTVSAHIIRHSPCILEVSIEIEYIQWLLAMTSKYHTITILD